MQTTSLPMTSAASRSIRRFAIGLNGIVLTVVAGCGKEPAATPPVPVVQVMTVAQRDVPIRMEWVGSLDGDINAVIRPQVTGYLIQRHYHEGELVNKGQLLFEIDSRTFDAALEEAKGVRARHFAHYETTKANLARVKPLAARNAVSQKDLDDATGAEQTAKAQLAAAEAALKTARLNLGFTRIVSPVKGIAGIAKAQIGDLLSPSMSSELTTVSVVDPIKVYFNISEREYLRVARAASGGTPEHVPLELILVDGSVYPHPGKFALLNRQVDPATGTFKVAALFPNPRNLLRPGQYGRIRATTSVDKGALLVPQRAVTEIQGKYLLAVVGAGNTVDVRPVTMGERVGSEWIVGQGLQAGETVVVEGIQKVRPGGIVNPQPFVPTAAPNAVSGPASTPTHRD